MAVGTILSSCSKEQSELTLDSVKGSATIEGTVLYDMGATKNLDATISPVTRVIAAGVTVLVKIDYSDYSTGSVGTKTFSTITNAEGMYTITVPVAVSADAKVSIYPFKKDHFEAVGEEIKTIENAFYDMRVPISVSLTDNAYKQANLNVTTEAIYIN